MTETVDIARVADPRIVKQVKRMTAAQRARLAILTTPRIVDPYFVHIPHPKQQFFLSLNAREVMYGGAAGGGKSDALLMAAAQYVDVPGYSALILRRTWPDLNAPGAILDRAKTWWGGFDEVHIGDGGRIITFPSGARIQFGYLQHEKDRYKFQSAEYQFVGFDELTHFTETQYTYLFSRTRRPQVSCLNCSWAVVPTHKPGKGWKHKERNDKCPEIYPDPKIIQQYKNPTGGLTVFDVPLRVRSATNPGGIGHEWVRTRFVDPATRRETAVFVPASLRDNPSLDRESYVENLSEMTVTDRERLLAGNWDVYEQGDYFSREMFDVVGSYVVREGDELIRMWDMASTEGGGDYTVGTLLCRRKDGTWVVIDVVRGQWSSLQKEVVISRTAAKDGRAVPIRMEQEPGSSGKDVIDHYKRMVLPGYNYDGIRSTGSKEERAKPFSGQAEAGHVSIVAAEWNRKWLDEMSLFPVGANDDQVDSVCGGANFLAFTRRSRLLA